MPDNNAKTKVGKVVSTVIYNCALRIFHPIQRASSNAQVKSKRRNLVEVGDNEKNKGKNSHCE